MSAALRCIRCGETFDEGDEVATVVAWTIHTCSSVASRCLRRRARLSPGACHLGGGSGAPLLRPITETRNSR
jgi:hypothetical protein